eukprot:jgi/Mesen1/2336/ME000155S01428
MQAIVRASPLSVWDKKSNAGFWRMLSVREGRREPTETEAAAAAAADDVDVDDGLKAGDAGKVEEQQQQEQQEQEQEQAAQVMLIVQVCPTGVAEGDRKAELARMAEEFTRGAASASPPLPLTVLLVQEHVGVSNAAPADCPLLPLIPAPVSSGGGSSNSSRGGGGGESMSIVEHMCGLHFRISPTAFF